MDIAVTQMKFEDFQPHVGTAFTFPDGGAAMAEVVLKDTKALTRLGQKGTSRVPFSLLFQSASVEVSPQRTYRLHHPVMGELEIFLVPVAGDADGITYEAIFN